MSSYLLRLLVETCLVKPEDLKLHFEGREASFLFSKKSAQSKNVTVAIEMEATNNREAQYFATSTLLPPVLDALSYATGTPLLLGECELILKNEAGNATRKAIFVGHRSHPSRVRLSAKEIQEVEEILANGDDLRLPLCWHRYALDRRLTLEQFVFHWLAFEALAGDADVVTRCPQCQAQIQHCEKLITHRGSNKACAREVFLAANPEVPVADFNGKIWGKARNSVFHGRHYPEPRYLVELNDLSVLIHRATDKRIATELALEEREQTHHGYESQYRLFLFVEWETRDRTVQFADDWPAEHLARMTAEPVPGAAYRDAEDAGIRVLDYQRESPAW